MLLHSDNSTSDNNTHLQGRISSSFQSTVLTNSPCDLQNNPLGRIWKLLSWFLFSRWGNWSSKLKRLAQVHNRCRAKTHIHIGFYFKWYFACKALLIVTELLISIMWSKFQALSNRRERACILKTNRLWLSTDIGVQRNQKWVCKPMSYMHVLKTLVMNAGWGIFD